MGNIFSSKDPNPPAAQPSTPVKKSTSYKAAQSNALHTATTTTTSFTAAATNPSSHYAAATIPSSQYATATIPSSQYAAATIPSSHYAAATNTSSFSTVASTSTTQNSQRSKPTVAKSAYQVIKHSAHNYVIPAVPKSDTQQIQMIKAPPNKMTDKFGLRVCPQYNSKNGCTVTQCRRLHVCFFWALRNCRHVNCDSDHNFTSSHNSLILKVFSSGRFIPDSVIISALKDNHKPKKTKEDNAVICMHNIMRKCTKKPCPLVHCNKSYKWEVFGGNNWVQFSYKQCDFLELLYCHPSQDFVELPPLHQSIQLQTLLSQAKSWTVDFNTMQLISDNSILPVRRLSTPSDITSDLCLATRWLWYWKDDDGSWTRYNSGCQKFFVLSLSDQFEFYLQFTDKRPYCFEVDGVSYELYYECMVQINRSTGQQHQILRRPACMRLQDGEEKFDNLFITLPDDMKFMHFPVLPSTSEFTFIEKMMKLSLVNINITSIKRIQNDHLWKTYQNRKKQLLSLYNGDFAMINEQYLFHGTKHSVIDQICSDNLDWRRYGSNVGHIFGRGIYFTNMASVSNSYSEAKYGEKAVFVVYALVGTMTVGDRNMDFPPENPKTGRCFDTTCNDEANSTIFVKYNRDDYYPAYIVKYSTSTI